jgi:streptogramin lyase
MPAMKNTSRLAALSFSSLSLLALAGALSMTTLACEDTSGGDGPSTDDGGPGTDAGADASTCSTEGTGSIEVVVSGLPDGVAPKGKVTGPSGSDVDVTAATTLADQPAGSYAVTAARVVRPDPIVRTVYEPTVSSSEFCLEGTKTQTVTIAYTEVGSSNKLWAANSTVDAQLVAYAGADLAATGTPGAKVKTKGASGQGAHAGKAVAFDKDGNLWGIGATTADAPLLRFTAADLGASGDKTPDRKINPQLSTCSPGFTSLAFDPSGALWTTSTCSNQILRVSSDTLSSSKDYTPVADDIVTGVEEPHALAFDKDGNLWVSGKTAIHRFSAASLAPGQPHTSDFAISAKAENDAALPPDALAFDKDGNLWVVNFGGNAIYKLTPADLTPAGATKEVVPSISITVSVSALLESLAFDESGGLWLTYVSGQIARLGADQLGTSTGPGAPTAPATILTSADLGSASALALFPAPANLPLYSRFE